jgi:hypothetical protein
VNTDSFRNKTSGKIAGSLIPVQNDPAASTPEQAGKDTIAFGSAAVWQPIGPAASGTPGRVRFPGRPRVITVFTGDFAIFHYVPSLVFI